MYTYMVEFVMFMCFWPETAGWGDRGQSYDSPASSPCTSDAQGDSHLFPPMASDKSIDDHPHKQEHEGREHNTIPLAIDLAINTHEQKQPKQHTTTYFFKTRNT